MIASLENRKILLGVTGGIAAYKAADLCRQLTKNGYHVRVVMTRGATEFVSPLTFQALTGNPVHTELLDPEAEAGMGHIELAKWPDLVLVAPATANFISLYAHGQASDLLSTVLLATEAEVAIAPAMNQAMWRHPLTRKNIETLEHLPLGICRIWGPDDGVQACGDTGPGRMLEPLDIVGRVEDFFSRRAVAGKAEDSLFGRRVVITAGPTREAIDPVRYISNHSSGKMGYALAAAFRNLGAEVVLVSGPVEISAPAGVRCVPVTSACEMLASVERELSAGCDILVAAAAVADYRVENVASSKLKKKGKEDLELHLCQNPDIVATVAAREDKPFVVGFAAETDNLLEHARSKMKKKNLDMIIANDVSQTGIGFNSDRNAVHVLCAKQELELPEQNKSVLAGRLAEIIVSRLNSETDQAGKE